MKRNFINAVSATGALGLLLALPGLVNAEDYYVSTKGYRTEPETDPPRYVRNLSKTQFEQFRDIIDPATSSGEEVGRLDIPMNQSQRVSFL